jgi:hypothetical protein
MTGRKGNEEFEEKNAGAGRLGGKGDMRGREEGGYEEKSRKYSKFMHVSFSMVAWPTEQGTNRGWK